MRTRRQREKWQTQVNRTCIRNFRNEGKLKTENKLINKRCLDSSVNAVLPWRTEVFVYLSGSRCKYGKARLALLKNRSGEPVFK